MQKDPVSNVNSLFSRIGKSGPHDAAATQISARQLVLASANEARACLSYEMASKLLALPLGLFSTLDHQLLTVACIDEHNSELAKALRFATGKAIRLISVPASSLKAALFAAYHRNDTQLTAKLDALQASQDNSPTNNFRVEFRSASSEAAQFLTALIDYAAANGASDLHLVPTIDGTLVRLRVNGELWLHEGTVCSLALHNQLIARLKVLSSLNTTIRLLPQDGSFSISTGHGQLFIRLGLLPTIHGESAVLRLNGYAEIRSLDSLGFDSMTQGFLQAFLRAKEGMALFAGPTGSGKSTSMYASLQHLAKQGASAVTIENPVEVHLPGIQQTSINEDLGLDYTASLKAALRQDPDAILLGEVRDKPSAAAAFQAALTGHLLMSTVHARNIFEILLRLTTLGIDTLTIAQTLRLAICQRLLPRLCDNCKVFDLKTSNHLGLEAFKAVGCRQCDYSGFSGRVLAAESLQLTAPISEWLLENSLRSDEFYSRCRTDNYVSLHSVCRDLLKKGLISANQCPCENSAES